MNKEFTEKLVKIQNELNAPKNLYNSFGKFKYRSCESILEAVKPLLEEAGLAILINDEIVLVGNRFYIKATATLSDGTTEISVSAYAREADGKTGMDDAMLTGATSSYARKYALNGLFAIDDSKDVDTDEYQNQKKEAAKTVKTVAKVEKKVEEVKPKNVLLNPLNLDTMLTGKQIELLNKLGEGWKKYIFGRYNVTSYEQLSVEQFDEIMKMLKAKKEEKEGKK